MKLSGKMELNIKVTKKQSSTPSLENIFLEYIPWVKVYNFLIKFKC